MSEDNWKYRSKGMICGTCKYFVVEPRKASEVNLPSDSTTLEGLVRACLSPPVGRCHRRAPTLTGWPATFASEWCGDYKLDENKI